MLCSEFPNLERGLFVEGARTARRRRTGPRVVEAAVVAASTTVARAAAGAVAATARAPLHLLHLRCGVPERGADLVDLELHDRALLALARLVRPLTQTSGNDHAGPSLERLGDVLGRLAPDVALEEQRFAVLPFVGLPVEEPRRRS